MTTDREELRALVEVLRTVSRHSPNVRYSSSTIPAALDRASRYLNRPAFGEPAPSPADPQYVVEAGWLALDVGRHTCAGGTPESGYAHEPSCGLEPLERVEVLAPLLVPEAEERGRQRGVQPFRDLFAGGPDTACRTRHRPDGPYGSTVECVEVPLDDLRQAFTDAGDPS